MPVVHNKGKTIGNGKTVARKIIFPKAWDESGKPVMEGKKIITEVLEPSAHKTVTDAQLAHLKANFHDEIVNIDDVKDMQTHFKEAPADKPKSGYTSPEDLEQEVEKRVKERLAAAGRDKVDTKPAKKIAAIEAVKKTAEPAVTGEPEKTDQEPGEIKGREDFIASLDGMDRLAIIELIEKEDFAVDHVKMKNPHALKKAVLSAWDKKNAAKEAA
jgi:hypothetical protein